MTDLGTLGGPYNSVNARAMNDAGQIVGNYYTTNGRLHAFIWDRENGMTDLGTLGGIYGETIAVAVNAAGQVAGHSGTADGQVHAFIWDPNPNIGMVDLGTLGGYESIATAMNDAGQVVGSAMTEDYWDREDGMTDLGDLGGGESGAVALNAAGQVAGNALAADGENHAFIWDPTVGLDCGPPSPAVTSFAFASDTSGPPTVTYSDEVLPGRSPGLGKTIARTWIATDACGNFATSVKTIDVADPDPPEVVVAFTPAVLWPANHKYVTISLAGTAISDSCDGVSGAFARISVSASQPDDAPGNDDGTTTADIRITTAAGVAVSSNGSPTVTVASFDTTRDRLQLRAERKGGTGRTSTVTLTAIDVAGNETTRSFTVVVPANQGGAQP